LNQHKEALHKDTNHYIEPKLKNLKNIKEFSQPRENLEDILLKRINEENLPKPCKLIYEKELYLSWDEQFCFFRFKESNIEVAHFLVPENDDFNIDEKKDSFSYQNFEGAFQRLIELLRSIGNINKSRIDDQRKKVKQSFYENWKYYPFVVGIEKNRYCEDCKIVEGDCGRNHLKYSSSVMSVQELPKLESS